MAELFIEYIELAATHAHTWGFVLVVIFMTVESSCIPFPSEVVMIPAGFLACRGELTTGVPELDLAIVIACGLLGSLFGAWINYWMSYWLGRPFLHRYGKYFFLKEATLDRAEEIFRKHGEVATFVCRLLPAIRQLISIPAGLSRMHFGRFTFFTGLGAGIWSAVLAAMGYYIGSLTADSTYREMVLEGKHMIHDNLLWLVLGLGVLVVLYILVHKRVMHSQG